MDDEGTSVKSYSTNVDTNDHTMVSSTSEIIRDGHSTHRQSGREAHQSKTRHTERVKKYSDREKKDVFTDADGKAVLDGVRKGKWFLQSYTTNQTYYKDILKWIFLSESSGGESEKDSSGETSANDLYVSEGYLLQHLYKQNSVPGEKPSDSVKETQQVDNENMEVEIDKPEDKRTNQENQEYVSLDGPEEEIINQLMHRLKWPESRNMDTETREFFYRVKEALPLLVYNDYVTQRRMKKFTVSGTTENEGIGIIGVSTYESSSQEDDRDWLNRCPESRITQGKMGPKAAIMKRAKQPTADIKHPNYDKTEGRKATRS
ncbi:hypothetical protein Pmani_009111 [Petrolisthes manimaculis]|uniref:Uncharacterized protein n=1 Tax=Petrolisthes manimaculis TaxID=1843537 RepID=A0AAE1Q731_9EUCA|nr:hypothetical protein Pmani_009111 [Petrolisthes manimaculis]